MSRSCRRRRWATAGPSRLVHTLVALIPLPLLGNELLDVSLQLQQYGPQADSGPGSAQASPPCAGWLARQGNNFG